MEEAHINFNFQARYYRSGPLTSSTRHVWFVLHGYGQLAQYFIRKFAALGNGDTVVIAPEGLSRFYLEPPGSGSRKSNRVGATWMTRENRGMDIENYLSYLNAVYEREIGPRDIPVTVLGFSQGAATSSRWVAQGHIRFARLILWSGIFPPDMNFEAAPGVFEGKGVVFVYGVNDPLITPDRLAEMRTLTEKLGVKVRTVTYEGGHDIDANVLREEL